MRLFIAAVLLGLSSLVNAAPPPPEPDCSGSAMLVYDVSVPTSDADGNYALTFKVPEVGWTPCSEVAVQESKNGGSYSSIGSGGSGPGSNTVSISGRDSAIYQYRVKHYFLGGGSASWVYSNEITVARKPNTPGGISFTYNEGGTDRNGTFKVNWGASSTPPKITGYQVWQCKGTCTGTSGTWSRIYSEANTSTRSIPVPSSGKLSNGNYRYRVRSYVTVGSTTKYSGWRYSSYITVNRRPDEVTNFTQPGSGTQKTNFQVAWSGVSGAFDAVNNYQLQCSINGGSFTYSTCGNSNLGTKTSMPVSLPEGTEGEYKFQARACNSQGCGPWTRAAYQKTVLVNIPYPPPYDVTLEVPESSDFGDYGVAWSAKGTVTSFELKRECKTGAATCTYNGWHGVQLANPLDKTYPARGDAADKYRYQVRACNDDACSGWKISDWIDVHNLDGILPAVTLVTGSTPGKMDYSADVTQQGDAVVSIPVQGAPGVNGLVPNIGIRYSGARYRQRNNEVLPEDILGYGWRLSGFGEIRRCVVDRPNTVSVDLSNNDSLCLNGEPLVLVSGSYWAEGSRYRTKRDRFHLIELKVDANGKKWFQVFTPDGRVQEYGNTADSRLRVGTSVHFGWSLNKVTDPFDNIIEYKYHRDTVEGINYPLEVTYGNGGDAKITFEYGTRTDAPPQPLVPDEIEQEQLVLLHHINVSLDGNLLREYRLISEDEGQIENYRRLQLIQLCAYDEAGISSECLNPLEFTWLEPDGGNPDVEFKTGVEKVTDGLGAITWFKHAMIQEGSDAGQFFERPFGEGVLPDGASPLLAENGKYRCAVGEVWRSNGTVDGWHRTAYSYQGTGLMSDNHRGFLGYYAQKVHDRESGIVTYRQFRLDFPHFGQVARLHQYEGSYPVHSQILTKQQFRYGDIALSTGSDISHYPVLLEKLEAIYEQNQVLGYSFTKNSHSKKDYGASGELVDGVIRTQKYATSATAPTSQSFWGEVKAASVSGVKRSVETVTSFNNRTGAWLIGFVEGEDVRRYDGNTDIEPDQVQTVTATPFGNSKKIDTVTRFPGDPVYELKTDYHYNANGNLTSETISGADIETRVSTATDYIDRRYPKTLTNPLNQTITVSYDPRFGKEKNITRDNRITKVTYDPFGREKNRTNTDGITFNATYEFCLAGGCPVYANKLLAYKVTTSSAITPTTERYYDQLGRLIQQDTQSFDGSTVSTREFNYDPQGRLYLETAPFFDGEYKPLTTYHYDERNRVTQVDRPDGSQLRTTYTALAASHEVKVRIEEVVLDSDGVLEETQIKESILSFTGDLVKTTDAVGTSKQVETRYEYYGSGLVESVKVNNDLSTESTFHYDPAGYRDSLTDPNLGTVITVYNALGQLIGQTDNAQQTITYRYDKLGRLRFQADSDGVAQWNYDPLNATGALANRSYVEGGILQNDAVTGGQVMFEEIYGYNSDGKLDNAATNLFAGELNRNYQHSYGYDTLGRLERVTYPSGTEAHYNYNGRGYLYQITDGVNPLKTFNEVNALNQTKEEVYGNGVVTTRTYDPASGRLETIATAGASQIQNNEYLWRSNGTLESRLVYAGSTVAKEENFGYDALNRLETAQTWLNGTSQRILTTLYDKLGNIESKTSSHTSDTNVTGYQYGEFGNAGAHAVSNVTIAGTSYSLHYNQNGAITHYDAASGDDKWVSWNARQLPTEIVVGTSKTTQTPTARDRFRYGPNGQRYYRESSWWDQDEQALRTEKTFIVGSFEDLLPANDPDYGRIQKASIDSNILHIAATDHTGITVNTLEYLHRDHQGSIEKITDEAGNLLIGLVNEFVFEPYGTRRKADWSGELDAEGLEAVLKSQGLSTSRGFTGHEHLDRTGLIHMNGRIYDPTLGRFLSPDPIVQAPTYSQSWNRYSYVVNNPLSLADPSGYIWCENSCNGSSDGWDVTVTGSWGAPDMGAFFWASSWGNDSSRDGRGDYGGGACFYRDPYCLNPVTPEQRRAKEQRKADTEKAKEQATETMEEIQVCGGGVINPAGECVAQEKQGLGETVYKYFKESVTISVSGVLGIGVGGKGQLILDPSDLDNSKVYGGLGAVLGASATATADFTVGGNGYFTDDQLISKTGLTVGYGLAVSFTVIASETGTQYVVSVGYGYGVSGSGVVGRQGSEPQVPGHLPLQRRRAERQYW